jgi:hypothetical protein
LCAEYRNHRGEGYVWSPSWLCIYKRVHFATKQTFDASATPEIGKATKAAHISSVDVDALKKDMADVVQQAEKDDPKTPYRRIAELEKQLRTTVVKDIGQKEIRIEVPVLKDAQITRLEKIFGQMVKEAEASWTGNGALVG